MQILSRYHPRLRLSSQATRHHQPCIRQPLLHSPTAPSWCIRASEEQGDSALDLGPEALLTVTKDIVRSCASNGVTESTSSLVIGITLRLTDSAFLSRLTISALAEVVPLLLSLWHEIGPEGRNDKLVMSLLETSAPRLTEAMAERELKPSEMVNIVWAYGAEDIVPKYSRDLLDQCNHALRGFSPTSYEPPCIGCPPSYDDAPDEPCVLSEERTMIPLATLTAEELGRVAWAYSRARNVDARHRTITDRPLFDLIAKIYAGEHDEAASDLTMGLVHIYSSISHYDAGFYDAMALSLSRKIEDFDDPALVLSSLSSFARVKHGGSKQAKLFLSGVYDKAYKVLDYFEPFELVQMARDMADLNVASKSLLMAICDKVAQQVNKMPPPEVLTLVRALATLQHLDESFVKYQETLLTQLRKSLLDQDVDEMTSYCGSGADGLER